MFATEYSLWAGGFVLGCLHALDADHLATVSTLILRKRALRPTLRLALHWSAGHSLTLLALAALVALGSGFEPESLSRMEHAVGLSMILLGAWILRKGWKELTSTPPHPEKGGDHSSGALFGMGILHGTAGWSAVLLMIPLAWAASPAGILTYVALFSLGMMVTMSGYAAAVHRFTVQATFARHLTKLRAVSAAITLGIGLRLLYS